MSTDLDEAALGRALGARAVRAFPALLSTEPVAMAWAREGAPSGAVVVADYQASPRGRAGLPWRVELGHGLGFTLLHRPPHLAPEREGWPYLPGLLGCLDVAGGAGAVLEWPDAVLAGDGSALARLGVYVELGAATAQWVTLTVLVEQAVPPRGPLLARLLIAIEARLAQPPEQVLADFRDRCATLGRTVRARLLPLGPDGPEVTGTAVDVLADGALVLLDAQARRVAIPPQNLGLLVEPQGPVEVPERVLGRPVD